MNQRNNITLEFPKPRDAWDALSMKEKAEMIGVAVRNGITNLNDIRDRYNEFAEGGNIYSGDEEETQQMEVSRSPHVDLAISNPWLYQKLHPASREEEVYEPSTFAGRVAQLAGVDELGQKYTDYTSSTIQQFPVVGTAISAADLGYDLNRLYHNPSLTTTKDVTLDAASLVPALRKTMKGWWMKGNSGSFITEAGQIINNPRVASTLEVALQPFRTAINTGVYGARAADFLDDSKAYLKEMYNSSKIGKHFPIKALGGPLVEAAMNEYKKGGSIHISPSKRGTFTAAAKKHGKSVQAFASQVLAHPENYSPAMRRKANFARNASHWKHGLGGNLFYPGGDTKASDYRYVLDDDGKWNRVANDEMGRVFQGLVVTPAGGSSQPAPARYRISYDAGATKDDAAPIRNLFSKIQEVAGTPIMVQANPGTATGYSSYGQYMPKSQSTYGDQANLLLTELTAPTVLSDAKGIYQVLRHPIQTAKAIRSVFSEGTPAAEWASLSNRQSFVDGKPEIGMYLTSDGKSWNIKRITEDLGKGITDARIFLGSDIKAASDAHNIELAKRLGFPKFTPYLKAQERASVGVSPKLFVDKNKNAGYLIKNIDPHQDEMGINIIYDADKGGFHETLHKGNYGEEGFSFEPEAVDFMSYHKKQNDTRGLYQYKTNKLLVPRTTENAEWHDYMSKSAEAATNSMEVGRRMGLEPGAPWPGRKKAMELFERYAASADQKTKAFNVLNWKQKPRRVWDALTGRYFVLGAGTIPSATLIKK